MARRASEASDAPPAHRRSTPGNPAEDAERRRVLRHFLGTLAYRTQKSLRGAPDEFASFDAGSGARTPMELVRHMTSVLGYARTFFIGGAFRADPLENMDLEVERFHAMCGDLSAHLAANTPLRDLTHDQLLQGPLSDAMTHAGQLAMLRRLAGSPVPSENFLLADVSAERLGSDQPMPAAPDAAWLHGVIQWAWRVVRWTARVRSRLSA